MLLIELYVSSSPSTVHIKEHCAVCYHFYYIFMMTTYQTYIRCDNVVIVYLQLNIRMQTEK